MKQDIRGNFFSQLGNLGLLSNPKIPGLGDED